MAHAVDSDFNVYTLALDRDELQRLSHAIDLALYEAESFGIHGTAATLRDIQRRMLEQVPAR